MLLYEDSLPRTSPPPAAEAGRAPSAWGLSLRGVFQILRRRALVILACALACTGIAFLVGKSLTPRYAAGVQLYLDPRDLRLMDKELTPGNQDSTGYMTIVESQAQVITSSNVLARVVASQNLARDPEFVGTGDPGLLGKIGLALGLSQPPVADPGGDAAIALDALQRRIGVSRSGRTFIVEVSVWSREAEKAARLANAVVAAYLAEEAANRADAANRASAGLAARLGELRDAVNAAESKVQLYRAANGLVGTRDSLVTDQQLTQLTAQLATARARATDAKARVDQIERMRKDGLDAGGNEDVLASQAITTLRGQYSELSRRQAELMHDLGPRHPLVSSIQSQVQQVRRLIDQEIGRFAQAARTDLARAQATVKALEQSFEQAKGRTVDVAQASIRLRELEREAEASRAVYEAFLVRARETSEQARLDIGNARVITPAVRPLQRSYPPPAKTLAMLGFGAGLLLGLVLAFGEDRLRREMGASGAQALRRSAAPFPDDPPRPPLLTAVSTTAGRGVGTYGGAR
ncbi:GumC family protein [Methylobacterium organophilum]|uniref:Chromosome partition protein Smc n=1 Tax=Methylobacterium organophilum TaxID=410 RepID=A0ABQ4T4E8_METOR|nr:GumC family protein [Methylobacterium organophilum]GJE26493.1 Chromosome partition protein Smc [Methylobacterium organophilum]